MASSKLTYVTSRDNPLLVRLRKLARRCGNAARRCIVVVVASLGASIASGACLTLAGYPDGTELTHVALPDRESSFGIAYVHSVTLTPVLERYRVDGSEIVQTEMEFEQHGPGLPTEADANGTFAHRAGQFVATMNRRFPSIVMRVHADQAPRLTVGPRGEDLAQWGNRALLVAATPGSCAGG